MIPALKAEFRKLLTVRSTYFIILISLALVALFAGFGDGFRAEPTSLRSPSLLMGESANAIVFVGLILAFAGLLLMGHEYRYNGIMYTLTSSNRRAKVLLAKLLVISAFALVTSLFVTFFSPLCTIVGAHLHGYHIGPQHYDYWSAIWRGVYVGWGYAMYGFIIIAILRNQVGSIVTFLLIPLIGENILGHIFRGSDKYFPFSSLQSVVERGPGREGGQLSIAHSAEVALVYIVVGIVASFVLFSRRDASAS